MNGARLILIGGGVRCGKTAFALARARQLGERRLYIATAQAFDAEMRERIAAHQRERAAEFDTVEEPLQLSAALAKSCADVIVVDCLTLWLSNLLLSQAGASELEAQLNALCDTLAARSCHVILVTNEVGMGLVPDNPLGRLFRDWAGRVHQRMAQLSDEIYFGMLGSMLRLRPEPVALHVIEQPHAAAR